jgi:hypothetical protein
MEHKQLGVFPIVIEKERNRLTISVSGPYWYAENFIKIGVHAGKSIISKSRRIGHGRAVKAAVAHAELNGWTNPNS